MQCTSWKQFVVKISKNLHRKAQKHENFLSQSFNLSDTPVHCVSYIHGIVVKSLLLSFFSMEFENFLATLFRYFTRFVALRKDNCVVLPRLGILGEQFSPRSLYCTIFSVQMQNRSSCRRKTDCKLREKSCDGRYLRMRGKEYFTKKNYLKVFPIIHTFATKRRRKN